MLCFDKIHLQCEQRPAVEGAPFVVMYIHVYTYICIYTYIYIYLYIYVYLKCGSSTKYMCDVSTNQPLKAHPA